MVENEGRPPLGETEKPVINTEAKLTKALGMTRKVMPNPVNWLREYQKDIENGRMTLVFQNGKYADERGQRITFNIQNTDGTIRKAINLCQDKDLKVEIEKTGLSLNNAGMFRLEELEAFGYAKLYDLLQELEAKGMIKPLS